VGVGRHLHTPSLQSSILGKRIPRIRGGRELSCGIDERLLEASGIGEFQYIEIYEVSGKRFNTCIIRVPRGSGEISLNGAAAREAAIGDLLIISHVLRL
jgi:aspartate 1-decarboxylase